MRAAPTSWVNGRRSGVFVFGLDPEPFRVPLDVVESQRGHLAGPQPVGGDEEEHRVVALPHGLRAVDGGEERADRVPWQSAWEALASIQAGRVDGGIESAGDKPSARQEAKERSKMADAVLEALPAETAAGLLQEGLDLSRPHVMQAGWVTIEADKAEQLRGRGAVGG